MRLLICAGGTGGGVYPALAVLNALGNDANHVHWVGTQTGMEAGLVERAGVSFTGIPAAGVHGVSVYALPRNTWSLMRGILASKRILRQYKPDVLFFTGGYIAAPMAIAGRMIPSLVFVPDIEPGLALKFIARFSSCIALCAEPSRQYFPVHKKLIVTGYPVRKETIRWTQGEARSKLMLNDHLPVILVMGGSKGASSINHAVFNILPQILIKAQVIHITGDQDWSETENVRDSLPKDLSLGYHIFPYMHDDIGAALASADLAISRSGASTLGEYPMFGLPAILVPYYPKAWRYQKVNAEYLAQKGAAVIIDNNDLGTRLLTVILELLEKPDLLESMGKAMRNLSQPLAAENIAELIRNLGIQSKNGIGEPS